MPAAIYTEVTMARRPILFTRTEIVGFPMSFQKIQPLSVRSYAVAVLLFLSVMLASSALAQQPILTSRADTTRSGANTNETMLTPSTVTAQNFGHLFSVPIDYQSLAQPLYVPNVNIGGQTHNVVYVVTQTDNVYAMTRITAHHCGLPACSTAACPPAAQHTCPAARLADSTRKAS